MFNIDKTTITSLDLHQLWKKTITKDHPLVMREEMKVERFDFDKVLPWRLMVSRLMQMLKKMPMNLFYSVV